MEGVGGDPGRAAGGVRIPLRYAPLRSIATTWTASRQHWGCSEHQRSTSRPARPGVWGEQAGVAADIDEPGLALIGQLHPPAGVRVAAQPALAAAGVIDSQDTDQRQDRPGGLIVPVVIGLALPGRCGPARGRCRALLTQVWGGVGDNGAGAVAAARVVGGAVVLGVTLA